MQETSSTFWQQFRNDMPVINNMLYLDHAAMSPLHKKTKDALQQFITVREQRGNDFSSWWEKVENTREIVAKWIHCSPEHIAFLWNTSACINLAAQGFPLEAGDEVLIPEHEFPSNVYPWLFAAKEKGIVINKVPYDEKGRLTAEAILDRVTSKTRLISVSWVSAHNGNVLDLETLGNYCKENHIYFVVDAIQGFCAKQLDLKKVYADLVVSGFFKWAFGPDGVSFVYVSERSLQDITSPWIGWAGMENKFQYDTIEYNPSKTASRFETGNMNFSALSAVHDMLTYLYPHRHEIFSRVERLTKRLRDGLQSIPDITLLSPVGERYAGITLFRGRSKAHFENNSIIVNERSGGIRVSPHFYNEESEIDRFLEVTSTVSEQ